MIEIESQQLLLVNITASMLPLTSDLMKHGYCETNLVYYWMSCMIIYACTVPLSVFIFFFFFSYHVT